MTRILAVIALLLVFTASAGAQDFPWEDELNRRATQNMAAFKQEMADRFTAVPAQVDAVLKEAKTAANAYLIFKMGELTGNPLSDVQKAWKNEKGKGWGAVAKRLGIKPGSEAFQALKNGHDLDQAPHGKGKGKDHQKGKGKKK